MDFLTLMRFIVSCYGWNAFMKAVGELSVEHHDSPGEQSEPGLSEPLPDEDFDPHWEVSDINLRWVQAPGVIRCRVSLDVFNHTCNVLWDISSSTTSSPTCFTVGQVAEAGDIDENYVFTVVRYLRSCGQLTRVARGHYQLDRDVPSVRYLQLPNNVCYGSHVVVL